MTTAVVFGYGDVGVRCLAAVLAAGIEVLLVASHPDDPGELQWYASVHRFAIEHSLPVHLSADASSPALAARVSSLRPDLIFSFYYRRMIPMPLLRAARIAALNLHGSLLPAFRGRAPINWAVLRGATQTGASLHHMVARPDAGPIVDQMAVPILPDDTAYDVFRKVCTAAELVLVRSLPAIVEERSASTAQDESASSYFGARRPEDGEIDWSASAAQIHNLVRAVAPPFPGARSRFGTTAVRILRTLPVAIPAPVLHRASLFSVDTACFASCGGGGVLRLLEVERDGSAVAMPELAGDLSGAPLPLGEGSQS